MHLHSLLLSAAALAPLLPAPPSPSVIIRHDRPDARYRELAAAYPATCDVGGGGVGALIAPRWVLTAAHVAEGVGPFSARVGFGGRGGELERQVHAVDHVVVHPGFGPSERGVVNDIALLRLAEPVRGLEPVPLYAGDDELGQRVTLVGCGDFGDGRSGPREADGLWRAATNTVLEAEGAELRFRFDAPDSGRATELEGFWGPGDSGCPCYIAVDGVAHLAGVSSYGYDPLGDGVPANYGERDVSFRVSHYAPWIRATLAEHAESAADMPTPRAAVDGAWPAGAAYELAASYFDALGADAAEREAFERFHVAASEDELPPTRFRIWRSGMLRGVAGPFELVRHARFANGDLALHVRCPQIEEDLSFTFRFQPGDELLLRRVDLGLVAD